MKLHKGGGRPLNNCTEKVLCNTLPPPTVQLLLWGDVLDQRINNNYEILETRRMHLNTGKALLYEFMCFNPNALAKIH